MLFERPRIILLYVQFLINNTVYLFNPKIVGKNKNREIILYLLQGMGVTHARLLLSLDKEYDEQRCIKISLPPMPAIWMRLSEC